MTRHTVSTDERAFGLSVGTACGLLSAVLLWKGKGTPAAGFGLVAAFLISLGLIRPRFLRIPNAVWRRFAQILGWCNTRILLAIFFFLVLTPVGLMARATGWDPLRLKRGRRGSGWQPYPARDPKHYEHLY